jgi:DNA-binding protein HU-beta
MNRRELIAAVAVHRDAEPKTVDAVLRGFTDVVCASVAKGDPVVLSGFAKFAKIETKARMGRNPGTGEAIRIKASKMARITPQRVQEHRPRRRPRPRGAAHPALLGGGVRGRNPSAPNGRWPTDCVCQSGRTCQHHPKCLFRRGAGLWSP